MDKVELSTPRLESDSLFHLREPFDSEVVDWLFRLKSAPRSWQEIKEMLKASQASEPLVRSFLTTDPPSRYSPYQGRVSDGDTLAMPAFYLRRRLRACYSTRY
jgi:Diiron non-heme beta-hydroxylase N-terminal domain